MNARQMQQMMKQMGIQQVDVEATQVIIVTPTKRIIIDHPQVSKVNMMGQQTWQVVGPSREEKIDVLPSITDEDIKTVMEQTAPRGQAPPSVRRKGTCLSRLRHGEVRWLVPVREPERGPSHQTFEGLSRWPRGVARLADHLLLC